MKIPGYMTAKEAKAEGFTHHGNYYGIPIWIGYVDTATPMVATKHAALEPLMTLFHMIEGLVGGLFLNREPAFLFQVGAPIDP